MQSVLKNPINENAHKYIKNEKFVESIESFHDINAHEEGT